MKRLEDEADAVGAHERATVLVELRQVRCRSTRHAATRSAGRDRRAAPAASTCRRRTGRRRRPSLRPDRWSETHVREYGQTPLGAANLFGHVGVPQARRLVTQRLNPACEISCSLVVLFAGVGRARRRWADGTDIRRQPERRIRHRCGPILGHFVAGSGSRTKGTNIAS